MPQVESTITIIPNFNSMIFEELVNHVAVLHSIKNIIEIQVMMTISKMLILMNSIWIPLMMTTEKLKLGEFSNSNQNNIQNDETVKIACYSL